MDRYIILLLCFCTICVLAALAFLVMYIMDVVKEKRLVAFVKQCREEVRELKIPEFPTGQPLKRGIIVVAGGPRYGPLAQRLVDRLDALQSTLDIEIWALNTKEIEDPSMQMLVKHPRVSIRNIRAELNPLEVKNMRINGYRSKSIVMVHTDFDQFLLLDADNLPLKKPDDLFETAEFSQHGAIFWPDTTKFDSFIQYRVGGWFNFRARQGICHPRVSNMKSLFNRMGLLEHKNRRQYESGQILMDRRRHYRPLVLSMKFNDRPDITYTTLLGDKDTYAIAFDLCESPYFSVPYRVALWGKKTGDKPKDFKGKAFVQRHPSTGSPLFAHFVGINQKHEDAEDVCTHIMYPTDDAKMFEVLRYNMATTNHRWTQGTFEDYRLSSTLTN